MVVLVVAYVFGGHCIKKALSLELALRRVLSFIRMVEVAHGCADEEPDVLTCDHRTHHVRSRGLSRKEAIRCVSLFSYTCLRT